MRTHIGLVLLSIFTGCLAQAQVAINYTSSAPDNTAMLDITSNTKGILIPRMTTAERTAITSPATGLLVYDNSLSLFYYYNGSSWAPYSTPASIWSVSGNSGTVSGTSFTGTADNQALDIKTNNILHTRIRTTGQIEVFNTGKSVYMGESAGINDDLNNRQNTGIGYFALNSNTTGSANTALGFLVLQNNTTAGSNTAVGFQSMVSNTTGGYNVAYGQYTISSNTGGSYNTALGGQAICNSSANYNVCIGMDAMFYTTSGGNNVAIGVNALVTNTTGTNSTMIGYGADVATNNLSKTGVIGNNTQVAQSNSLLLGGTGGNAVKVGIGNTTPLSAVDVTGTVGFTVKSGQVAGTNNPDNTASIWFYTSGAGTVTLPAAASYTNRIYEIINQTGVTLNISSYNNLAGTAQTTLSTATTITIVSNGTSWLQIR